MSKEEIETGNQLIAEFMGYSYYPFKEGEPLAGWRKPNAHLKIGDTYLCRTHKSLPYRYDWNELMKVVDKIDGKYENKSRYNGLFKIETGVVNLVYWQPDEKPHFYSQRYTVEVPTIICVWEVIVDFVRWYNENVLPDK